MIKSSIGFAIHVYYFFFGSSKSGVEEMFFSFGDTHVYLSYNLRDLSTALDFPVTQPRVLYGLKIMKKVFLFQQIIQVKFA